VPAVSLLPPLGDGVRPVAAPVEPGEVPVPVPVVSADVPLVLPAPDVPDVPDARLVLAPGVVTLVSEEADVLCAEAVVYADASIALSSAGKINRLDFKFMTTSN